MDMTSLIYLIENNFWYEQLFIYSATSLLNYTFKKINDRFAKKDIAWQLMHCLQGAHSKTCEQLKWECNNDAYIDISKELINHKTDICNKSTIVNIFTNAVGHEVNFDDIECWISNFEIELASKEHEHLREFIKLKLLIKENSIPYIERKYIEKFQQPAFPKGNILLSLCQLYIPNEYKLNGSERTFDDLMELLKAFISGNIDSFLCNKNKTFYKDMNTLFVFGHQCTGKSTLVSKILYDHYLKSQVTTNKIHVVNFNDRNFRKSNLTPREIADYLLIDVESFKDAVLIIDGLDESGWSGTVASDKIEQLINDLREYKCKLIITSRPNFLYSTEIKNSIDINLAPFSLNQAKVWLDFYKEFDPSFENELIFQQISSLSIDIRNIILIPYIFHICVIHNIKLNQITELARLYDVIFCGDDAEFLTTRYNSKYRNTPKEWITYQKMITKISQYILFEENKQISATILDEMIEDHINSNKITSEFLLYRKDDKHYAFVHDSIPCYFVAKHLYDIFVTDHEKCDFNSLIELMSYFYQNGFVIPISITFFIEYFSRTGMHIEADDAIMFLKSFLAKKFDDKLTMNSNLQKIQEYYYSIFINTIKLTFATISPKIGFLKSFNFFENLEHDELKQFVEYTKLGDESLDYIKICSFSNTNLNGIKLKGVDLRGKMLRNCTIQNGNMNGANLSGAYFISADLSLSCFENANCKNTDFTDSLLFKCSFKNARLNGANFTNANLNYADLRGAQLNKCKFNGASLIGAKIYARQLRDIFDFDIEYIRENKMEIYCEDCLIPDEILEDEYRRQRPVNYALNYNKKN